MTSKDLIYDVGAHEGEDTQYYLAKGFRVIAVEANPVLAERLRARFDAAIASGRLVVVQAAVADADGEVEFFVNEKLSVWGTIDQAWAERNLKKGAPSSRITVPAISFRRLLDEHGTPHYLKVDIEGADMLCVYALESVDDRPSYLSIESNKTSWRNLRAEFDTLCKLGYTRFKVVDQANISRQVEPDPVREGTRAAHRFTPGSTGLFGADLPGKWLTRNQALRRYGLIFLQYRFFGDNTLGERIVRRLNRGRRLIPGWYDTHASRDLPRWEQERPNSSVAGQ